MQKNHAENDAQGALEAGLQGGLHGSHKGVMTQEVVELFAPLGDGLVLDATFGRGGHAHALLTQTACRVFAIDCDHEAIAYAKAHPFFRKCAERFAIVQGCFASASELLATHQIYALDGVLFDYGISSAQLDNPERGFSFQRKGPLDMRMAQQGEGAGESALEFLQNVSEQVLVEQFYLCGEPQARKLARALLEAREQGCLPQDTQELAELIRRNTRKTTSKIARKIIAKGGRAQKRQTKSKDAATLAFMAIRIAVNNELEQIAEGLLQADKLLKDKGRVVAISFHSLEDRIVKRQFSLWTGRSTSEQKISRHRPSMRDIVSIGRNEQNLASQESSQDSSQDSSQNSCQEFHQEFRYRSLSVRLQRPQDCEILENPRARSAKLRAVEKCALGEKNDASPATQLAAQLVA